MVIAREDQLLPLRERLALGIHMKLCDTCPFFERQVITMRNAMRAWRNYQAPNASELSNSDAPEQN